jgi:hypothetical protein
VLKQGEQCPRQEGGLMVECWKTLALIAILMLTGVQKAGAFRAYDCNNQSSTVEQ